MPKSFIPLSSYVIAVFSTVALLIVSALAGLILIYEKPLVARLQASVLHIVELSDVSEAKQITATLKQMNQINDTTIVLRTGDMARNYMKQTMGIDFELNGDSPFSNVITFNTNPIYEIDLRPIPDQLRKFKSIKQVIVQTSYFKELKSIIKRWKHYLWIITVLIAVMAFIILSGLFRLILYGERLKIKTMELVGATRWTIVKPFILRIILIALIAMLIAVLLMFFCLSVYLSPLHQSISGRSLRTYGPIVLSIWSVILAAIVGLCLITIDRFTTKQLDDLA